MSSNSFRSLIRATIRNRASKTACGKPTSAISANSSPYFLQHANNQAKAGVNTFTSTQVAFFSSGDDSHNDFAPKRAVVDGEDEALKMIAEHVKDNSVMLYMKGNPSQPQCGFSMQVVQILQKEGVDFSSVNVLDYPTIREGVKKFSDWPTIPQLYVKGEFLGGCDIVKSLHESGELKEILNEE